MAEVLQESKAGFKGRHPLRNAGRRRGREEIYFVLKPLN